MFIRNHKTVKAEIHLKKKIVIISPGNCAIQPVIRARRKIA